MMISVVLDSVGSICATCFFIDLVFSDVPVGLAVALAPLQLLGGLILGSLAALALHGLTKVFLTEVAPVQTAQEDRYEYPQFHQRAVHHKVLFLYTVLAVSLVFFARRLGVGGGGAIAVLSLAATLAHLWRDEVLVGETAPKETGPPGSLAGGASSGMEREVNTEATAKDVATDTQSGLRACEDAFFPSERKVLFADYAFLWDNIVTPTLFAMAGSKISLWDSFNGRFFPAAISTILAGVATRVLFACASAHGQGFTVEQIVFVGVGWVGKAAVQAVLGGVALQRAEAERPQDPARLAYAQNIETTAMLSAMLCAPLGACAITVLGRRWLPRKTPLDSGCEGTLSEVLLAKGSSDSCCDTSFVDGCLMCT